MSWLGLCRDPFLEEEQGALLTPSRFKNPVVDGIVVVVVVVVDVVLGRCMACMPGYCTVSVVGKPHRACVCGSCAKYVLVCYSSGKPVVVVIVDVIDVACHGRQYGRGSYLVGRNLRRAGGRSYSRVRGHDLCLGCAQSSSVAASQVVDVVSVLGHHLCYCHF